jgi:5'-3' exonuclease
VAKTLLALDGNSVLHRSFHAGARTGYRTHDGRPGWAVRGLLEQLVAAVVRSRADAVVVGFDDPGASVRRERWPAYKAHRPEKPETLTSQLTDAAELLSAMGVPVTIPTGLEADDVLASAARTAREAGWQTVLATSDRDAFALIDDTTRVLRLINGGVEASPMLTAERLVLLTGVTPAQYRDLAALRGDPSDNLPGVRGVGKVLGARLLTEFGTAEALFEDIDNGGERCLTCVGPATTERLREAAARELWSFNRRVMAMHDDVDLGLDLADDLLPLAAQDIHSGYQRYGLSTRQPLQVLCGLEPPAPPVWDEAPLWQPAPPPVRRYPRLPKSGPVLQDTLF